MPPIAFPVSPCRSQPVKFGTSARHRSSRRPRAVVFLRCERSVEGAIRRHRKNVCSRTLVRLRTPQMRHAPSPLSRECSSAGSAADGRSNSPYQTSWLPAVFVTKNLVDKPQAVALDGLRHRGGLITQLRRASSAARQRTARATPREHVEFASIHIHLECDRHRHIEVFDRSSRRNVITGWRNATWPSSGHLIAEAMARAAESRARRLKTLVPVVAVERDRHRAPSGWARLFSARSRRSAATFM